MKDFREYSKIKIVGNKFDIPMFNRYLDFNKQFLLGFRFLDEFFRHSLTWKHLEIILDKIHERNL